MYSSRYPRVLVVKNTDRTQRPRARLRESINELLQGVEGELLLKTSAKSPLAPIWVPAGTKKRANTDFAEFEQLIKLDQYDGLLLILVSGERIRELAELVSTRAFAVWNEIVEFQTRDHNLPGGAALDKSLALAELVCLNGGAAVVVIDKHVGDEFQESINDRLESFRFRVASVDELDSDYLGCLTLRRKAGYRGARRIDRQHPAGTGIWGPWSFEPVTECDSLIAAEFSDPYARDRFVRLCAEAISGHEGQRRSLTKTHRIVLAALRLARKLVTQTLEGTPFGFTLLIPSGRPDYAAFRLRPVLMFDALTLPEPGRARSSDHPGTYFNFDFVDVISNHVELAQTTKLWMIVDSENGALTNICSWAGSHADSPRHLVFSKLTREGGIIVHGCQGKVEVYGGGRDPVPDTDIARFALGFDGFRWKTTPFLELRRHLQGHLVSAATVEALEGAVSLMLDYNDSSLIVLVDTQDLSSLLNSAQSSKAHGMLEGMRENVHPIENTNLGDLQPEAIRGLLHVDGAHFIDNDGKLVLYAQRVKGHAESPTTSSRRTILSTIVQPPGSGTNAAIDLVGILKHTSVIKVSASGRLKFFGSSHTRVPS